MTLSLEANQVFLVEDVGICPVGTVIQFRLFGGRDGANAYSLLWASAQKLSLKT